MSQIPQLTTSDVVVDWAKKRAREMRAQNQDMVLPINGDVGDGKSTLGIILGLIIDDTLTPDALHERMSWDGDTHIRLCERAPRYAWLQLDEGEGIIAQDAMSGTNRRIKRFLYRCRKLNLWQIYILPEYDAMQGVLSDWRADERFETDGKGKAILKRRGDHGYWKDVFEFEFPSLEGLEIWDRYEVLADRASRGEDVHDLPDQDADQVDPYFAWIRRLQDELAPLAEIARNGATLEDRSPCPIED